MSRYTVNPTHKDPGKCLGHPSLCGIVVHSNHRFRISENNTVIVKINTELESLQCFQLYGMAWNLYLFETQVVIFLFFMHTFLIHEVFFKLKWYH